MHPWHPYPPVSAFAGRSGGLLGGSLGGPLGDAPGGSAPPAAELPLVSS